MRDESDLQQFIAEQIHNEGVRKNIEKFHETGKFLDDDGNEIEIGKTINYEVVE